MARRRQKYPKSSKYSPRRRRRGPGVGAVILIVGLIAAGIWFVPRMNWTLDRGSRNESVPEGAQALADSTDAATRRGDWDRALAFGVALVDAAPNLSGAQRKLSVAWHNYGTGVRTIDGALRPAQRTSLGKVECELAALSAADSARVLASGVEEWLGAAEVYGKTLEYMGLPVDALSIYVQMLQQQPDHPVASARAAYLTSRLENPLQPD